MKVYRHFEELPEPARPCVVTIGSFDGLHRGHQLLLERVREKSKEYNLLSGAMTFRPHPAKVLAPSYSPPLLMSPERRIRALATLGLDFTLMQHFDREFAGLSAGDFAGRVLAGRLSARQVVIGDDFTFGRDRQGRVEDLIALGRQHGFGVEVVPRLSVEGMVVSSTRIRSFLLQGRVRGAALLLGRPYSVPGRVVTGKGRGRKLGFPTANVRVEAELLPARGVYVCYFRLAGWSESRLAVTNVGFSPTFGAGELGVEVHVLDRSGDFVGRLAQVSFVERIRAEQTFRSGEELARQIEKDVDYARQAGKLHHPGAADHPFDTAGLSISSPT